MTNIEFTFLSNEEVFGPNHLHLFDCFPLSAPVTDFALLQAIKYENCASSNPKILRKREGAWVTRNIKNNNTGNIVTSYYANYVYKNKLMERNLMIENNLGARPATSYNAIKDASHTIFNYDNKILIIMYGIYPQWAVSKELNHYLNQSFYEKTLIPTSKVITRYPLAGITDVISVHQNKIAYQYEVYKYNNRYYTLFKNEYLEEKLSNGKIPKLLDHCWLEVSPILWLVDVERDIALAKNILFSKIFERTRPPKCSFKETATYKYLNTNFANEIKPFANNPVLSSSNHQELYCLRNEINTILNRFHPELKRHETIKYNSIIEESSKLNKTNLTPKINLTTQSCFYCDLLYRLREFKNYLIIKEQTIKTLQKINNYQSSFRNTWFEFPNSALHVKIFDTINNYDLEGTLKTKLAKAVSSFLENCKQPCFSFLLKPDTPNMPSKLEEIEKNLNNYVTNLNNNYSYLLLILDYLCTLAWDNDQPSLLSPTSLSSLISLKNIVKSTNDTELNVKLKNLLAVYYHKYAILLINIFQGNQFNKEDFTKIFQELNVALIDFINQNNAFIIQIKAKQQFLLELQTGLSYLLTREYQNYNLVIAYLEEVFADMACLDPEEQKRILERLNNCINETINNAKNTLDISKIQEEFYHKIQEFIILEIPAIIRNTKKSAQFKSLKMSI